MVDKDLAIVDPFGLPFSFLEKLRELKVRTIEITPADNKWIVNSLAIAPGELIMPEGATNRTLDQMAKHGLRWTTLAYDKMQLNGGGIHCSTTPLIRDSV
jgi:arginine deiminase